MGDRASLAGTHRQCIFSGDRLLHCLGGSEQWGQEQQWGSRNGGAGAAMGEPRGGAWRHFFSYRCRFHDQNVLQPNVTG